MKKLLILVLCLLLSLTAVGCGNKNNDDNAPLSGIRTAEADDDISGEDGEDENPDRTEETDRKEIENNLRDARELIEHGYFEDARMLIDGLKTRDLTSDEKKELLELQKKMITVSD